MKNDSGDDIVAEINVTPLVDVVLVLLIIFIVTARFTLPPSIKVDLPQAANPDAAGSESPTTMVTLKPGGELYLDENLPAQLAELHAKNAAAQVVINADENVLHGAVVRVLDMAKRAGIEKVAISIEEKPL
jgi:biopolymer transport protein ExbD